MKTKRFLTICMSMLILFGYSLGVFAMGTNDNSKIVIGMVDDVQFQMEKEVYETLDEEEREELLNYSIEAYLADGSESISSASTVGTLTTLREHTCVSDDFVGPRYVVKSYGVDIVQNGKIVGYLQYYICGVSAKCEYVCIVRSHRR